MVKRLCPSKLENIAATKIRWTKYQNDSDGTEGSADKVAR